MVSDIVTTRTSKWSKNWTDDINRETYISAHLTWEHTEHAKRLKIDANRLSCRLHETKHLRVNGCWTSFSTTLLNNHPK